MDKPWFCAWMRCFCIVLIMVLSFLQLGRQAMAQNKGKGKKKFTTVPQIVPSAGPQLRGPSNPTGTGRPPRVGPNIQDNALQEAFPDGLLGRSETSIVTSEDGSQMLVGFNDAQGFCGPPFGAPCTPENPPGLSGYAFSTDGGLTFMDGGAPPPFNNVFSRGDPWMDRGGFDNATFFYSSIAIDATTGANLGIGVYRGQFAGKSFAFSDVHTFNSSNPNDLYDKDAFGAAHDGSGAAYATITNFIELCGQPAFGFGRIEVWRTHDSGNTWQGPTTAGADQTFITDPTNPLCGLTGTLQQASMPASGPNGEVYVAWSFGPTFNANSISTANAIKVAASFDGGATFHTPVTAASINSNFFNVPVGDNRSSLLDEPWIAVDTASRHKGRIYVTFSSASTSVSPQGSIACPNGFPPNTTCVPQSLVSSQIYITQSDDHGATWSTPVALASPPAGTTKRWWPVVKVEPGGNVDVIYLQSLETATTSTSTCIVPLDDGAVRVGPANSLVDTYWVQSTNFGASFSAPTKVSSATSNWCTAVADSFPNFGDYISAFATGNHVYAAWGDGRNGIPDTFDAVILGAGKSSH